MDPKKYIIVQIYKILTFLSINDSYPLVFVELGYFSKLQYTRCLPSRLRCLKAIKQNYGIVVMHLDDIASGQLPGVKAGFTSRDANH